MGCIYMFGRAKSLVITVWLYPFLQDFVLLWFSLVGVPSPNAGLSRGTCTMLLALLVLFQRLLSIALEGVRCSSAIAGVVTATKGQGLDEQKVEPRYPLYCRPTTCCHLQLAVGLR
jgi:hypothetical protein